VSVILPLFVILPKAGPRPLLSSCRRQDLAPYCHPAAGRTSPPTVILPKAGPQPVQRQPYRSRRAPAGRCCHSYRRRNGLGLSL